MDTDILTGMKNFRPIEGFTSDSRPMMTLILKKGVQSQHFRLRRHPRQPLVVN
jgi:hypothetical protein